MKQKHLLCTVCAGLIIILSTTPEISQALIINDGGSHVIDYSVTDGLDVGNGMVTLEAGADISDISKPPLTIGTLYVI